MKSRKFPQGKGEQSQKAENRSFPHGEGDWGDGSEDSGIDGAPVNSWVFLRLWESYEAVSWDRWTQTKGRRTDGKMDGNFRGVGISWVNIAVIK